MSEFTCAGCKKTFEKMNNDEWNSFKMAEEFLSHYPEAKNDPVDVLCDPCYKEFRKWFVTLSEEDKERIRKDYFRITGNVK